MSYFEFTMFQFKNLSVTEIVIKRALKYRGHERRLARAKPPVTEKNIKLQQWAGNHIS